MDLKTASSHELTTWISYCRDRIADLECQKHSWEVCIQSAKRELQDNHGWSELDDLQNPDYLRGYDDGLEDGRGRKA